MRPWLRPRFGGTPFIRPWSIAALGVNALAVRRYRCIPEFHGPNTHPDFELNDPL
jgi:hypothetical protein